MSKNDTVPRVGLAVFIRKGPEILIGQRYGSHGNDTWQLPGGHLEYGESFEECAVREVKEETGLTVSSVELITATNDIFKQERKHYITLFTATEYKGGTPTVMEPNKCREWRWTKWGDLPTPLFLPLENFIKSGGSPFAQTR